MVHEDSSMTQRCRSAAGVLLVAGLCSLAPGAGAAQSAKPGAKPAAATPPRSPARQAWTAARTPWGDPDLQGIWLNATITPLERPAGLADKPFLTEEEAAALERQTLAQRAASERAQRAGEVGSYNNFWFDSGTKVVSSRQTSLVIEPADGRVPVRPEAEKIREENLARSGD